MPNAAFKPTFTGRIVRLIGRLIQADWYRGLVALEAMRQKPEEPQPIHLPAWAMDALEDAIVALPEPHMRLLILFMYEDYSVARLARIFGLSQAKTVRFLEEALDRVDTAMQARPIVISVCDTSCSVAADEHAEADEVFITAIAATS